MKTLRQLFRQPFKTISGLLLMTIAASILCVCVGQTIAAKITAENLNNQFTTIVLPAGSGAGTYLTMLLPEEVRTWLNETAESHPDIVKLLSKQGFLSAYVPGLAPMNFTTKNYEYIDMQAQAESSGGLAYHPSPKGMPYSCAMMVIELETVEDPSGENTVYWVDGFKHPEEFNTSAEWEDWYYNWGRVEPEVGYSMVITGTIKQVVSLQDGYRDPTGMTARLSLTARTTEELLSYDLVPGQQYIVYGMDYYDADWALRCYLYDHFDQQIDSFDMSKMHVLTPEERERYYQANKKDVAARYESMYLKETEYIYANAVVMSLAHPISEISYDEIRDESGKLLEVRPITDYSYIGTDGEQIPCSEEEFIQRYQVPTIAHLEGSVEEFLKSKEGTSWQEALERDAINNQAFGVVGVDKLSYLADFAMGRSRVVEGRDFTAEELKSGARVCILSEVLAATNGLQIGDTITLNLYATDESFPYMDHVGYIDPTASFYFSTTSFADTAEYTIVGFFRGQKRWPDQSDNIYGFSPNTIFVPNASVQTEMEHRPSILFTTPVLYNGRIEEFKKLTIEAGYQKFFVYDDQGYSVISKNFHNYEELARQVVTIGAVIYLVLLFLFLLMYPAMQKKTARTMQSLGTTYGKRFWHILSSSAAIIVPATVLGGFVGVLLWDRVVSALQDSANAATGLQLEPNVLVLIAGAQLLLTLLLTIFIALFVAAPRGMSRRKLFLIQRF